MIACHGASTFVALAVSGRETPDPDWIRDRLASLPGVDGVRPDLSRGRVHVLYDGKTGTLKSIIKALKILDLEVHVPGYIWHSRIGA
jgi:hypothetical protein